jgi:hypothetical protein
LNEDHFVDIISIAVNGHRVIAKVSYFVWRSRKIRLVFWTVLSFLVAVSDYFSGPIIQFPFIYIFPIVFATWFNGRREGLVFACVLPLVRIIFSFLWTIPWSLLDVLANAVIRIIVFSLIVFLVDSEVKRRSLAKEVKTLRGLLPICSFCRRIRTENNTWIPLEEYINQHSEAEFSHGFCPDCLREHYGVELPSRK